MQTQDIIKSLGLISPTHMPPALIAEIHERLTEAERLQRENEQLLDALRTLETMSEVNIILVAQLETAVMHLNAILGQHCEASDSLIAAEKWLRSVENES